MISPKENVLRTIKRQNPKWVPDGFEATKLILSPVVEHPLEGGYDIWGCKWLFCNEDVGSYPDHKDVLIKDICNYKDYLKKPDVTKLDWSKAEKEAQEADRDQYLIYGFVEMGIFERLYILLGMEEALVNYVLEPDLMYEIAGIIADYKIEYIKMYKEKVNPDVIWYGDDWGTQNDLFISEDTWRKIIKPHTQRIYDEMKRCGILINQHSCGKIERVFGDMVEMGADMYNPCQPCNDLPMLKKKYGDKICFQGGIDSQFIVDNPLAFLDDIRNEVKFRIETMSDHGGYIPEPSHFVKYDGGRITAMHNAIHEFGGTYFTQDDEK